MKPGQSKWSRANERKRVLAGGRRLPGGILPPEAAQALESLLDRGYADSRVGCIAKALIEAAAHKVPDPATPPPAIESDREVEANPSPPPKPP